MSDGMLTAEQVKDAWCGNLKRDCLYDPPTPDWQAIADDLNAMLGAGESRWFGLFGTPERAARTYLDYFLNGCDGATCADGCPFFDTGMYMNCALGTDDYGALLEWLSGDAE